MFFAKLTLVSLPGLLWLVWSGICQQTAGSLVVSNGAGNWFPLRTSAAAEIIQIAMHRARS